jgi:uncharacterized protein (DUF362 family)
MNRREFLQACARYSLAAGAGALLGNPLRVFGQDTGSNYDMAAVMGDGPAAMFDVGIAALGGIQRFVKRGQVVLIKPNASWNVEPERGATTTPSLLKRIVEHCVEAGASKVYVVDHTIDNWKLSFETTQIESAAKQGGGQVIPGSSKGYFHETAVPGAKNLKNVMVHEMVLEADVIINVPVLKHHGSTTITCALKNLMGLVWDRWYYHANDLHRCIAEFALLRTPTLNVVDAHTVMMSGGPRGSSYRSSLKVKKMQIISPDIVAADAAAAATWGTSADNIRYINIADELGLGTKNLDALNIKRVRV